MSIIIKKMPKQKSSNNQSQQKPTSSTFVLELKNISSSKQDKLQENVNNKLKELSENGLENVLKFLRSLDVVTDNPGCSTNKQAELAIDLIVLELVKKDGKGFMGYQNRSKDTLKTAFHKVFAFEEVEEELLQAKKRMCFTLLERKQLKVDSILNNSLKSGDLIQILEDNLVIGKGQVQSIEGEMVKLQNIEFHYDELKIEGNEFNIANVSLCLDKSKLPPVTQKAFSTINRGSVVIDAFEFDNDEQEPSILNDSSNNTNVQPNNDSSTPVETLDTDLNESMKKRKQLDEPEGKAKKKPKDSSDSFDSLVQGLCLERDKLKKENDLLKKVIAELNVHVQKVVDVQFKYPSILPSNSISLTFETATKIVDAKLRSNICKASMIGGLQLMAQFFFGISLFDLSQEKRLFVVEGVLQCFGAQDDQVMRTKLQNNVRTQLSLNKKVVNKE